MTDDGFQPRAWDEMDGVKLPAQSINLAGHGDAVQGLVDKYRAGRLHHAWLVTGPRGIGKATMAYRFAEYVIRHPDRNSAPQKFNVADDAIHSQISKGAHPNVLTLQRPWDQKQKKFKTGLLVDEIRKVGAFLHTASGADAWRFVLVDPADDMTTSAANALLKLLEEPPARTLFFVLAHSPRGLLPTIRSRCQVLGLKPLNEEQMRTVLSSQELTTELGNDEVAKLIARSGGSARKALELASGGVVETFEAFVDLVANRKEDIGRVYQIAGTLSPAGKAAQYQLFTDMLNDHLAAELRARAANDQVSMDQLNALVTVWEKFRLGNSRAETWNMDKKQVLINLYRDLRNVG